jgi:aryl-alcohol dehydrogenase-like predicted oxidoreductase
MYAWQFSKLQYTAAANGWTPFVSMQNHYNLLYREEEREMLPLCREEGLGVIPWSPLARGLLAGASTTSRAGSDTITPQLYDHPADEAVIAANAAVARARGVSPAQTALAWLLQQPSVSAPIVGATKLAHLEAALAAIDLQLTPDERSALEAPYRPHAVRGHQ